MKDHEIRILINEARDTANKYAGCQCMREVLAHILLPKLKDDQAIIDQLTREVENLTSLLERK